MTEEEKPADYIYSAVPRSKRESVAKNAEARVTETVKSAVQSYFKRYLDPDGIHREMLNLTAGFSVQFETRIKGSRDNEDPSIYQVQLERYWGELRTRLPCIIIVDSGFEYVSPGIGGITDSWPINVNTSSIQLTMLANVTMDLKIAALDETSCADIRDILVYILGPLSHANKGHVIRSNRPEDRWEVRMPLEIQTSGLERSSVTDDPKDILWSTSIGIQATFEGLIQVGFNRQAHPDMVDPSNGPLGFDIESGRLINLPNTEFSMGSIGVPEVVHLSQHTPITGNWLPARAVFRSDNPRVALVDSENWIIIPRRPGSFNVLLQEENGGNTNPITLHSWPSKVVVL